MIEVGEYKVKEGLYYTKEHEWAQVLDDGTVLVGISDYAQKELGDVAYVELPEVGKEVSQGDVLCEIESVKAVSEVYAPVSGEVVEVNGELEDSPEKINEDPYGAWIAKIKPSNLEEDLKNLMTAEQYAEYLKSL
ncbi:glycine cleavage system protein GcvH [Thermococcus sp. M39]|uniref:glycine cleavage system protein GcvH n=1 Tax=unclassified Thermococcus TaxID=2627626 RepID=UPI00143881BB|nr:MULTISPECIES: glycine cleavage system protein GcvH [unclassified Thermococcus]MBO8175600.1 glycine cleavage system protein GcvH [Thermococcus sp.]NJE08065.1 glycine cleavage system protein GcvH [Thermococcus sp. M39]NJE11558.1 glycine cleavage system protein GcvH [Thermococcus sp. LS2]